MVRTIVWNFCQSNRKDTANKLTSNWVKRRFFKAFTLNVKVSVLRPTQSAFLSMKKARVRSGLLPQYNFYQQEIGLASQDLIWEETHTSGAYSRNQEWQGGYYESLKSPGLYATSIKVNSDWLFLN